VGIETSVQLHHWNYFLAIEEDLLRLSRFIEFHEANFGCFSLELARIILAAGAEVDVVRSQLCKQVKTHQQKSSRKSAMSLLLANNFPDLIRFEVRIPRFGLVLHPWVDWDKDDDPLWWQAYNEIKHKRNRSFNSANLKNALNAVAGLFVIILHYYCNEALGGALNPAPRILRVSEAHQGGVFGNGIDHEHVILYRIPRSE